MAKGKNAKKAVKKEATKSLKEKRAEKKAKKAGREQAVSNVQCAIFSGVSNIITYNFLQKLRLLHLKLWVQTLDS